MSDNRYLPPAGDEPTPTPAAPGAAPIQPVQAYPGAAPTYGEAPPQQGYAPLGYGGQPPAYSPPAPEQPYYGAVASAPQIPGYSAYGAPAYPVPRPSSGLAVTSLICGIAGIVLSWAIVPVLASIAAVITGHMALRQTSANPALGGRGMAFAGLIMGYFVIGVMLLMIAVGLFGVLFFGAFTLPFIFSS